MKLRRGRELVVERRIFQLIGMRSDALIRTHHRDHRDRSDRDKDAFKRYSHCLDSFLSFPPLASNSVSRALAALTMNVSIAFCSSGTSPELKPFSIFSMLACNFAASVDCFSLPKAALI